jgi:hypothetical protein
MSVVVRIESVLDKNLIDLYSGPRAPGQRRLFVVPKSALRDAVPPGRVKRYGMTLLQALLDAGDEKLKDDVNNVLATGGCLSFLLESDAAEKHSWEALYQNSFVCLDQDKRVARLVRHVNPDYTPLGLDFPLRILALLSATRISAQDEWSAILGAARDVVTRPDGFPISLTVLTGEEELMDRINEEARKNPVAGLTVKADPVPVEKRFEYEINRPPRPHVVHFFCHGHVDSGVRELRIADVNNYPRGTTYGVPVEVLAKMRVIRGALLVVFNACKSALGESEMYSITRQLVCGGAAAAVGMMEKIDPIDSKEFSERFYPALLDEIGAARDELRRQPGKADIELAKAMYGPRSAMSKSPRVPDDDREWTFPVLYVRQHGIQVQSIEPSGRVASADNSRKGIANFLPPDTPPEIAAALAGEGSG